MTYYFIFYKWIRYEEGRHSEPSWKSGEYMTDIHPVKWLVDMRNEHNTILEHNKKFRLKYTLTGWNEVSQEIYDTYKDEIG